MSLSKPKREDTLELSKNMEDLIPLRLSDSNMLIKINSKILIQCTNNRKVLGKLKAVDSHRNLVLENAKEMWTESPTEGKGELIEKERFAQQIFLKAEDVITVYLDKSSSKRQ